MRPCAMVASDQRVLIEMLLYSWGYENSRALTDKLLLFSEFCQNQIGSFRWAAIFCSFSTVCIFFFLSQNLSHFTSCWPFNCSHSILSVSLLLMTSLPISSHLHFCPYYYSYFTVLSFLPYLLLCSFTLFFADFPSSLSFKLSSFLLRGSTVQLLIVVSSSTHQKVCVAYQPSWFYTPA